MASMVPVEEARDRWSHPIEFILSCLGYAVGLGNVIRFPYVCGQNGGAAFMIPYLIVLFVAGFPTFYLEVAVGQFAGATPHKLYSRMCPIFGGIGFAMVATCYLTCIYYNMVIALALHYLAMSPWLPWADCANAWNDEHCFDVRSSKECSGSGEVYFNDTCHEESLAVNESARKAHGDGAAESPAQQYLRHVLGTRRDDGRLEEYGSPQWQLVLCLFVTWLLVFGVLVRGIKSSGKVVYFTALFPYFILAALFVRGITLDGAVDGVLFFVKPNTTYLADWQVWNAAATQIFFSLSLSGGLSTLSSYNEFHNNLFRDTFIVVVGNCATSVLAGFVVFPFIGFIAKQVHPKMLTAKRVAKFAASGPALAYVVYADAVTQLPGAEFWSVLFFFMVVMLGIDSQSVLVETVITSLMDEWPQLRVWHRKMAVVGAVCSSAFLFGIVFTCPGGILLIEVFDKYAGGDPLVIIALVELAMIGWVYGVRQFVDDMRLMLGAKPPNLVYALLGYPTGAYWWFSWLVTAPFLIGVIYLCSLITFARLSMDDYTFPYWAEMVGGALTLGAVGWIPAIGVFKLVQSIMYGRDIRLLWTTNPDWWPSPTDPRRAPKAVAPANPPPPPS